MNSSDPYFILKPKFLVKDCPKKVLPYLSTIRRVSEWVAFGFPLKLDEHGYNVAKTPKAYWFRPVEENAPLIAEAIRTGKKAVNHPAVVFQYVSCGCSLSEFAALPEDVKAFCEGNLLRIKGEKEKALPFLKQAVMLNPNDANYSEIYYPLRMELGDLSGIEEEFVCFEQDIDAIIHVGRFEEWIKALIAAKDYQRARQLIGKVDVAIARLVDGVATAHLYGPQNRDWYVYKQEQFRKKAATFSARISLTENKTSQANF